MPAENHAIRLPSPDERPAALVVLFDGHCTFCRGQVERLARWDRAGRLAFLSFHDPKAAAFAGELTHEELMRNMYVVDRSGRKYKGAAAFRLLTRRVRRLWPLAPLLHLPGSLPLWQFLYGQVASRRYRLGRHEPCEGTCPAHRPPG